MTMNFKSTIERMTSFITANDAAQDLGKRPKWQPLFARSLRVAADGGNPITREALRRAGFPIRSAEAASKAGLGTVGQCLERWALKRDKGSLEAMAQGLPNALSRGAAWAADQKRQRDEVLEQDRRAKEAREATERRKAHRQRMHGGGSAGMTFGSHKSGSWG